MYFYPSLVIGDYFLFLPNAHNGKPVTLKLRDHERQLKSTLKKRKSNHNLSSLRWRERTFLTPTILSRKWFDYMYRDYFIPTAYFDNILPLEVNYQYPCSSTAPCNIVIRSVDMHYRFLHLEVKDTENRVQFRSAIKNLSPLKEKQIIIPPQKPGIYMLNFSEEDRRFTSSPLIFYDKLHRLSNEYDLHSIIQGISSRKISCYCAECRSKREIYLTSETVPRYIYKNYIPFKDYIDTEKLGMEYISNFIMKLQHPSRFKQGLVHLLNMIRLASLEDELTIIKNLYVDDPIFAHFITERLFLFKMIPLMIDTDVQEILRGIDDYVLAGSLFKESAEIINKVFSNISKRRAQDIRFLMEQDLFEEKSIDYKGDVNKIIRSYFMKKYGRVLRIPYRKRLFYRIGDWAEAKRNGDTAITTHDPVHGNHWFILRDGNIYEYGESLEDSRCFLYDVAYLKEEIFSIYGINDINLFLKSNITISYGIIHLYDWNMNIENIEHIEEIQTPTVIPINYISSSLILTIGVLDKKRHPHEQIIRLKIKPGYE